MGIKVKLLNPLKTREGWNKIGSILELDEKEVETLSKIKPNSPIQIIDVLEDEDEGQGENSDIELFKQLENMEDRFIQQLIDLGIDTWDKLEKATKEDLEKVNGIGSSTAEKLLKEISETEVE